MDQSTHPDMVGYVKQLRSSYDNFSDGGARFMWFVKYICELGEFVETPPSEEGPPSADVSVVHGSELQHREEVFVEAWSNLPEQDWKSDIEQNPESNNQKQGAKGEQSARRNEDVNESLQTGSRY